MSYKIKGSLKKIYKAISGKDTSASSVTGILDDIATSSEGIGIELPKVTSSDNGDVLTVVEGAWAKATPIESSASVLTIGAGDGSTLDKTWKEIHDAFVSGTTCIVHQKLYEDADDTTNDLVVMVDFYQGVYDVFTSSNTQYATLTEDGYPSNEPPEQNGDNGGEAH